MFSDVEEYGFIVISFGLINKSLPIFLISLERVAEKIEFVLFLGVVC